MLNKKGLKSEPWGIPLKAILQGYTNLLIILVLVQVIQPAPNIPNYFLAHIPLPCLQGFHESLVK